LVKPKVICALGGHAAKTLLKTEESAGRLRERWHFYRGIPLRVTYHPSYLLRPPGEKEKKKLAWDDIQHVMRLLAGEEKAEPGPGSYGDPSVVD
jgi:DNA polymerase